MEIARWPAMVTGPLVAATPAGEARYLAMTQSPQALATARRNVVQRIARFIETLEQEPREPDPWESEHVQRALAALEELDFPRGEQAMMWAEWAPGRRA